MVIWELLTNLCPVAQVPVFSVFAFFAVTAFPAPVEHSASVPPAVYSVYSEAFSVSGLYSDFVDPASVFHSVHVVDSALPAYLPD
jgi:hypothetical protein